MKILIIAHTIDENGRHVPGDVVEFHDAAAQDYLDRGLAVKCEESLELTNKGQVIETPEQGMTKETATTGRKK